MLHLIRSFLPQLPLPHLFPALLAKPYGPHALAVVTKRQSFAQMARTRGPWHFGLYKSITKFTAHCPKSGHTPELLYPASPAICYFHKHQQSSFRCNLRTPIIHNVRRLNKARQFPHFCSESWNHSADGSLVSCLPAGRNFSTRLLYRLTYQRRSSLPSQE